MGQIIDNLRCPYQPAWISLLDPSSYNIKEAETRNTLWCDSPRCSTARRWKEQKFLSEALLVKGQWGELIEDHGVQERQRYWEAFKRRYIRPGDLVSASGSPGQATSNR